MGLINAASGNSVWRGLEYNRQKKVLDYKKINDSEYIGKVQGSNNEKYNVEININHTRKSKCNCPHADGKRIICKHMIALFFTVFPDEVDKFLKEVEKAQEEYEEYEEELYYKTIEYIQKMTKKDLQDALIEMLEYVPDWVYERFVRDNIDF